MRPMDDSGQIPGEVETLTLALLHSRGEVERLRELGSVLVAFPVPFWRADAIRIPFSRHIWRQGA